MKNKRALKSSEKPTGIWERKAKYDKKKFEKKCIRRTTQLS